MLFSTGSTGSSSRAPPSWPRYSWSSVIAILREDARIANPTAEDRLQAGDFVALTGSHEAIAAARPSLEGHAPDAVSLPRHSAFFKVPTP